MLKKGLIVATCLLLAPAAPLFAYDGYGWKKPTLNDYISPSAGDGYAPTIDVNVNGDAIIAWSQKVGNEVKLLIATRDAGTWTKPPLTTSPISAQYVVSPPTGFADYARVATSRIGDSAVVWRQNTGAFENSYAVYYAERRAGSWVKPAQIGDFFSIPNTKAEAPRVAMNDYGDTAVVWQQMDNTSSPIHIRIYGAVYKASHGVYEDGVYKTIPGQWLVKPSSLSEYISTGNTDATDPEVTIDNRGNVTVVWNQDNTNDKSQIFVSQFSPYQNQWTTPLPISDESTIAVRPHIAVSKRSGLVVATWLQNYDAQNPNVYFSFPSPIGSNDWLVPPLDHYISIFGYTSCLASGDDAPDVAVNDYNNMLFSWDEANKNFPKVQETQVFMAEQRNNIWTAPQKYDDHISIVSDDKARTPRVAMNNRGYSLIVWPQRASNQDFIFMSEYTDISGVWKWQNPLQKSDAISPTMAGTAAGLDIAVSQRGYAAIVWSQYDGAHYRIYLAERLP